MIGYVTLGTDDLARGAPLYDAIAEELKGKRMMEFDTFIAWTGANNEPGVALTKPFNQEAASIGNGVMVAFQASSPEQVDRIYQIAMDHGAADEGPPGPRGEGFYAGYFRDLDGNKLNAFCMTAA
ncbi:MAG: VOC family protein [Pseudomonadota bacterium]